MNPPSSRGKVSVPGPMPLHPNDGPIFPHPFFSIKKNPFLPFSPRGKGLNRVTSSAIEASSRISSDTCAWHIATKLEMAAPKLGCVRGDWFLTITRQVKYEVNKAPRPCTSCVTGPRLSSRPSPPRMPTFHDGPSAGRLEISSWEWEERQRI